MSKVQKPKGERTWKVKHIKMEDKEIVYDWNVSKEFEGEINYE